MAKWISYFFPLLSLMKSSMPKSTETLIFNSRWWFLSSCKIHGWDRNKESFPIGGMEHLSSEKILWAWHCCVLVFFFFFIFAFIIAIYAHSFCIWGLIQTKWPYFSGGTVYPGSVPRISVTSHSLYFFSIKSSTDGSSNSLISEWTWPSGEGNQAIFSLWA